MTINISLSSSSINHAISQLQKTMDNLDADIREALSILAKEGTIEANKAYGRMVHAFESMESETQAKINVPGGDTAIIAEFGAGYATMEYHPFAQNAPVPIEVASYSKNQYPYGLFYITNDLLPGEGYWFFGGKEYDRVEPRHGLLNAYDYIMANSTRIAKEVIKL